MQGLYGFKAKQSKSARIDYENRQFQTITLKACNNFY